MQNQRIKEKGDFKNIVIHQIALVFLVFLLDS